MRQTALFCILSIASVISLETQEMKQGLDYFALYGNPENDPETFLAFARCGDEFFLLRDSWEDYESFRLGDIGYRPDGYGYRRLFGKEYIVVPGPHDSIFVNTEGSEYSMYQPERKTYQSTRFGKIRASSFLKEASTSTMVVEYRPENMMFVMDYGQLGDPSLFYHSGLPWSEGERGPGVGVDISIEFEDQFPRDHVLVLNGYVDFGRRHLYKANNRVKLFQVQSADDGTAFSFTWKLEDLVKIQEIKLPRLTQKVRLTILDVYPGSRWDDTCIRGFLLKAMNWTGEKATKSGNSNFLDYLKRTDEELDENLKKYKRY